MRSYAKAQECMQKIGHGLVVLHGASATKLSYFVFPNIYHEYIVHTRGVLEGAGSTGCYSRQQGAIDSQTTCFSVRFVLFSRGRVVAVVLFPRCHPSSPVHTGNIDKLNLLPLHFVVIQNSARTFRTSIWPRLGVLSSSCGLHMHTKGCNKGFSGS